MGDGTTRRWICQSAQCGAAYVGSDRVCPECGRTAAPASSMKVRGVAATVAGLFLFGMMSMLELALAPQLLGWQPQGSSTSFIGTQTDGIVVLILFVALWLVGLLAILSGVVMILKGRRSTALLVWMVPPLLVIVTIVVLILGGFVLKG